MSKMKRLKQFRVSNELTQKEMAVLTKVSLSMYEKVERGTIKPSRGFMEKMKEVYPHINIDYIFFGN